MTVEPPARPTFEVKVERETERDGGPGELSIELDIEWDAGGAESDDAALSIE